MLCSVGRDVLRHAREAIGAEIPVLASLAALRDRSVGRGWVLGRVAQVESPPVAPNAPKRPVGHAPSCDISLGA